MTPPPKPVVGLIGGIGAGKSRAAAYLAGRRAAVIDCDKLGHAALDLPQVRAALGDRWGPTILRADGTIDRRAVAGIVFADPAERQALERIVFPPIGLAVEARVRSAQADPAVAFVVLDAAVLLEAGWAGRCDRILYVDAPPPVRLARLAARSGWTPAEVAAREAAQLPAAAKRAEADAVVSNDGSAEHLQVLIDDVLRGWGLLPEPAPS